MNNINNDFYIAYNQLMNYVAKKSEDLSDTVQSYAMNAKGYKLSNHIAVKLRVSSGLNGKTTPPFELFLKMMNTVTSIACTIGYPVNVRVELDNVDPLSEYKSALDVMEKTLNMVINYKGDLAYIINQYYNSPKNIYRLRYEDVYDSNLFSVLINTPIMRRDDVFKSTTEYKQTLEDNAIQLAQNSHTLSEEEYDAIMNHYIPRLVGVYTEVLDTATRIPFDNIRGVVDDVYDCL